jgi:hypothetical protein
MVTSVFMSRYTKIMTADLAQIGKSNIRGIVFHLHKNIFDSGHVFYSINIDIYVKPFFKWFTITQGSLDFYKNMTVIDFGMKHASLDGKGYCLGQVQPLFTNPKDLNVSIGYIGRPYFPCRLSIHRIASESLILPR